MKKRKTNRLKAALKRKSSIENLRREKISNLTKALALNTWRMASCILSRQGSNIVIPVEEAHAMSSESLACLSDNEGNIFDHPSLKLSGRSGDRFFLPHPSELVPLPKGSQLFTLPGRVPAGWDEEKRSFVSLRKVTLGKKEVECTAVAAFLPPGYIRTLLPATHLEPKAPTLPLWAYSAVGWKDGKFWGTGLFIDPNPHWNQNILRTIAF
jgi:hypothetical protein